VTAWGAISNSRIVTAANVLDAIPGPPPSECAHIYPDGTWGPNDYGLHPHVYNPSSPYMAFISRPDSMSALFRYGFPQLKHTDHQIVPGTQYGYLHTDIVEIVSDEWTRIRVKAAENIGKLYGQDAFVHINLPSKALELSHSGFLLL